jgi:hypothetical protein
MAVRGRALLPRLRLAYRALSVSARRRHERLHEVLPPLESFARRHIGPSSEDTSEMLKTCGVEVCTCVCVHGDVLEGRTDVQCSMTLSDDPCTI